MRNPRASLNRSGLSLIELLLAIAIVGLLAALTYSLHRTTHSIWSGQMDRAVGDTAADALDRLRAHLWSACAFSGIEGGAFTLGREPETGNSVLSFCRAVPSPAASERRWDRIERVVFRVDAGEATLLLESRPFRGPGSEDGMRTNRLADGITRFAALAFDGEEWHPEWLESEGEPPRAIAVEIDVARGDYTNALRAEILIPAAARVTAPALAP